MIVRYAVAIILPDQEDEELAQEEAAIVMNERLTYDEWYGFDYEIDYDHIDPEKVSDG